MKRRPLHLLSVALATSLAVVSPAAHLRLFILTGQSNSLGTTNAGEADPSPGADAADAHIPFYWANWADASTSLGNSGGAFQALQAQQGGYYAGSATHWGPEVGFARTLHRAGVRDFAIVKCSRGGGGNSFWLKGSADPHMYNHVVSAVTGATAALTAAGHTFEIAGLLYLQGESDSPAEAAVAGARLKTLVDNLRVDLPNATSLVAVVGGIAAPGATRDTVRANQQAIADSTAYIDFFGNLDLQSWTAADNLHFNKDAKLRIGERYAQAFLDAGVVARHYGRLVFLGDSITQGGSGDHPSYRYRVFTHLANAGVPASATSGYAFVGSLTGAYQNGAVTTPAVAGQTFTNVHDGHWGWRVGWTSGRLALPAGRYNINNLGAGTLRNWLGQTNTFTTADVGTLTYTGATYVADTASILIGINDLADGVAPTQVCADVGSLIDQLRAANPAVSIFVNKVLHTAQGATRDAQVEALNALLPALVAQKNAVATNAPVWLVDPDAGFAAAAMTHDGIHPNAAGEVHVGDRIAAALGLIESPMPSSPAPPPHIESGSGSFAHRFEGHEIWNGTNFLSGWNQFGSLTKSLVSTTDLRVVHPSTDGRWIGSTNGTTHPAGWDAINGGNWTFETRLRCNAVTNGFILWLGTDTHRILVEINAGGTEDYDNNETEANTFSNALNNVDGAFHVFRIAHDAANACYHVWRDGQRLTPLAGVAYDATAVDGRLILGDYTSGAFGNFFDVTIDYIRYDGGGAYLPTLADADHDGLPDAWEYFHFGAGVTNAVPTADNDADGVDNISEYVANTDPMDPASVFAVISAGREGGLANLFTAVTSPQRFYALYRADNLGESATWTNVAGPVTGIDGPLALRDTTATGTPVFYRLSVSLP